MENLIPVPAPPRHPSIDLSLAYTHPSEPITLNHRHHQNAMQKLILFPSITAWPDMKILSWKKGIRQHNNFGQE